MIRFDGEIIECEQHSALNIPHGFFGRKGGVSTGHYATLNGAYEPDHPEAHEHNRQRCADFLGVKGPYFFPFQRHTTQLQYVPSMNPSLPCDGLITRTRGVVLGIQTADCGPLIVYDNSVGVLALVHVGWRGALHGIIQNTLHCMYAYGACKKNTVAVLGPTIQWCHYPVQENMLQMFSEKSCFIEKKGKLYFDLPRYIEKSLHALGVDFFHTGTDTYGTAFFSHRYAQSIGHPYTGRSITMASLQ